MQFHRSFESQRTWDPIQAEKDRAIINPWTDMEKCIFFDRFLQYPKDFRKIASFLKNKSTANCVEFYYNSKKTMPYKTALKEHGQRKKKRSDASWMATVQCSLAVGARLTNLDGDRPIEFTIPERDDTYRTDLIHPVRLKTFDRDEISLEESDETKTKAKVKGFDGFSLTVEDPKFRSIISTTSNSKDHVEEPKTTDLKRKSSGEVGDASPASKRQKIGKSSQPIIVEEPPTKPEVAPVLPEVEAVSVAKISKPKLAQKWNQEEKRIFFETLEKHGT